MSHPTEAKIVLLGAAGAGKTSLVLQYIAHSFSEGHGATIGASFFTKMVQLDERLVKLNIWDTAGQERFHSLARTYYVDANAAILVYDITDQSSFEELVRWHSELVNNGPLGMMHIIVGTKEDLVESESVDIEKAMDFANSIGADFKKTSAKTGLGVNEVFIDIAKRVSCRNNENNTSVKIKKRVKPPKKCC